ncbi:MAG: hypothetical protein M3063_10500 [Actinomycetota bacterium]|nr:hypothetical protein [Actinomycetota bacterium]
MFKRARWLSMGAAVGFGGSIWAQRRVRRTVERCLPEHLGADVAQRARYLADDVLEALDEGRAAMRQREEELRRQLGVHGPPDVLGRRLPAAERGPRGLRSAPPSPMIDLTEDGDVHARTPPQRRRRPRRGRPGE